MLSVVLLLAVFAACGNDDNKSDSSATTTAGGSATTTAGGSAGITIKGFKFSPASLNAKVGDSISVTNDDGTSHSATADDGSFDTTKFSSGTKTIKVEKAGSIAYHCQVHPDSMKGVIVVS
jgi:plastocyanin